MLDCIRYPHAAQLRQAKDCDPLAAIAYIADNIAAAADRRQTGDETQFDRYLPLSPVFTHLNGEHPGHTLPPHALDGRLRLPLDGSFRLSAGASAPLPPPPPAPRTVTVMELMGLCWAAGVSQLPAVRLGELYEHRALQHQHRGKSRHFPV